MAHEETHPGLLPGPHLIKTMNARTLLNEIRKAGHTSRADLSRVSGLSKPTVSTILSDLEEAELVRQTGRRTGVPGPAAVLFEIRAEARHVLGIDVGREYLRAGIVNLQGKDVARSSVRSHARDGLGRVDETLELVDSLLASSGLRRSQLSQAVIGGPGIYDPERGEATLTGDLADWANTQTVDRLRSGLGANLIIENDVNAATYAEQTRGQGRGLDTFVFVSIGTGVGMGLVIDGVLHRGAHRIAGEIGYLPFSGGHGGRAADARRRGGFEAAASAAAIVRAARRAGVTGVRAARDVFDAASSGDERARHVVAEEASLIARAICSIVVIADPQAVILGGGIGQADGFVDAVQRELDLLSPVRTPVIASALGSQSVLEGCLAQGIEVCWDGLLPQAA